MKPRRRHMLFVMGAAVLAAALLTLSLSTTDHLGPSSPGPQRLGKVAAGDSEPDAADAQPRLESREIRFIVRRSESSGVVAGALVWIVEPSPRHRNTNVPRCENAVTGPQGRATFIIPEDWRGLSVLVSAEAANGLLATPTPKRCTGGELVELLLVPACRFEGRVIGLSPGEHENARIMVSSLDWPEFPKLRVIPVRPDFSFTVGGVTRYAKMYAAAEARAPSEYWIATLKEGSLRPGEVHRVNLALGPHSVPLRVRVVDTSGRPLPPGSQVSASVQGRAWLGSWTDTDGWVQLKGATAGEPVRVHVWAQRDPDDKGWRTLSAESQITSRDAGSELIAQRAAPPMSFRLLGADGLPLPNAELGLLCKNTNQGWRGRTDDVGVATPFDEKPLPPGEYSLTLHEGTEVWRGRAGEKTGVIPIQTGLVSIRVSLLGPTGIPVPASHVGVAVMQHGDPVASTLSNPTPTSAYRTFDDGGELTLLADEAIFKKDAVIRARFMGVGVEDFPLDGRRSLEIRPLSSTGSVRVRLHGIEGPGILALVFPEGSQRTLRYYSRVSREGSAHFFYLPSGTYDWYTKGLHVRRAGTGHVVLPGTETVLDIR